jgi:hypothetical protein
LHRLREYHFKKWYNELILGLIKVFLWIFSLAFALIFVEYFAWFSVQIREVFFYVFFLCSLIIFVFFTYNSFYQLVRKLSDSDFKHLAKEVGQLLPKEYSDELLNYLQLNEQMHYHSNDLISAAIMQKEVQLIAFKFQDFLKKDDLKQPLIALCFFLFLSALGQFSFPTLFKKPALRLWNYSFHYSKELPFEFIIQNNPFYAIAGEPTEIKLFLKGKKHPNEVFLLWNGERIPMKMQGDEHHFIGTLPSITTSINIQLEAGKYFSEPIHLEMVYRPGIENCKITLKYPSYLKKTNEELFQVANLKIPEGTQVTWKLDAYHADHLGIYLVKSKETIWAKHFPFSRSFTIEKQLFVSNGYQILASNKKLPLQKSLQQSIEVVRDQKPKVNFRVIEDTLYYRFKVIKLDLEDDYGINRLNLHYQIHRKGVKATYQYIRKVSIPLQLSRISLDYVWQQDSLNLQAGDQLEYYFEVFDNDGIHGSKMGRSEKVVWEYPSKQALLEKTSEKVDEIGEEVQRALSKAQEVKQEIGDINKRILLGKEINKNTLNELSKKEAEFKQAVDNLKKLNEEWLGQQMSFQKIDPIWQQKMDNLQKLIQQLWDPNLDKEKDKMIENFDNENPSLWKNHLDQIRKQGKSIENELKRLEKFYQELKIEKLVNETIDDLKNLSKEQLDLSNQSNKLDELSKQEELTKQFKQDQNNIQEAEKEQEKLEDGKALDPEKELQKEIDQLMNEAEENLKQKENSKANDKQKKASKKLNDLAQKMQSQMEKQDAMELNMDIAKLRLMMEDLLQISFEQERLMKVFRSTNPEDPALRKSMQEQIRLGETVRLVQDSLQSIAKQLMPVSQIITKEGVTLRQKMDDAAAAIKERKWSMVTYRQQEAMASTNKLAILLSDLLKQIQEQQMQLKPGKKKSKSKSNKAEWSKRQKQLNEKLQKMKDGNSSQSNEEWMKLAEEQFRIRQEIEQKMQELNGLPGLNDLQKSLQNLAKEMDKNETELVNKRLTNVLQNTLLPRLLEAEKSLQEQGEETKRAAKSALQKWKENPPPNLIPYLKKQAINQDLYQQVPVNLLPNYKEKVVKFLKSK